MLTTEGSTRAELVEALMNINRAAMRLPSHFVAKRAELHRQIDELLTLIEMWDDEQTKTS